MRSLCERKKKVLSSTLRMWETKDGCLRQSTRNGTHSARPFSKESKDQSVKPCVVTTRACTKQLLWAMK